MKKKILSALIVIALTVSVFSTSARADYYTNYTLLKYGMQNSEVVNLQNDLNRLGYFNTGSTGYFGSITKQSVVNYQKANYLLADGIVGHATAKQIKTDRIIQTAEYYLGAPYVWGGASTSGFDCSGLIHFIFVAKGVNIPRVTEDQYNAGISVSQSQLKKGDLVFFTTYKPGPSHVGIYIGNRQFIHASSGAGKVITSSLDNSYYASHYIGARRVLN
jgi:cell wall-associated NlpC family hydrolase